MGRGAGPEGRAAAAAAVVVGKVRCSGCASPALPGSTQVLSLSPQGGVSLGSSYIFRVLVSHRTSDHDLTWCHLPLHIHVFAKHSLREN